MIINVLWKELPYILKGVLVVIELLFALLSIGFLVGILSALIEVYGSKLAAFTVKAFERILRGIPVAVLLFLVYYGFTGAINISSLGAAIIALGLRSGAYQSQIFRGAIQAVASDQESAARSLGMSRVKSIFYIILPQALRLSIGPWSNEFSAEVKATSLAYLIGVVELLRRGKYIVSYTYGNALIVFTFIALFYLILTRIGNSTLYRLEEKFRVPGLEGRNSGGIE